jgi:hypothetical protein
MQQPLEAGAKTGGTRARERDESAEQKQETGPMGASEYEVQQQSNTRGHNISSSKENNQAT